MVNYEKQKKKLECGLTDESTIPVGEPGEVQVLLEELPNTWSRLYMIPNWFGDWSHRFRSRQR